MAATSPAIRSGAPGEASLPRTRAAAGRAEIAPRSGPICAASCDFCSANDVVMPPACGGARSNVNDLFSGSGGLVPRRLLLGVPGLPADHLPPPDVALFIVGDDGA